MSVKKNYRQVTYHNWRHAFNVGQTMFAIIKVIITQTTQHCRRGRGGGGRGYSSSFGHGSGCDGSVTAY